MNIHITNNTQLPFMTIGNIFDRWLEKSKGETFYLGRQCWTKFEYRHVEYTMYVEVKQRCWLVEVTER